MHFKRTKFDFGWGSAPDPDGGVYSAPPESLAKFKGPLQNVTLILIPQSKKIFPRACMHLPKNTLQKYTKVTKHWKIDRLHCTNSWRFVPCTKLVRKSLITITVWSFMITKCTAKIFLITSFRGRDILPSQSTMSPSGYAVCTVAPAPAKVDKRGNEPNNCKFWQKKILRKSSQTCNAILSLIEA